MSSRVTISKKTDVIPQGVITPCEKPSNQLLSSTAKTTNDIKMETTLGDSLHPYPGEEANLVWILLSNYEISWIYFGAFSQKNEIIL